MERSHFARTATVATLATSGAVAFLAARPDSPFTPYLHPTDTAPRLLAAPAEWLGLDGLSRDVAAGLGAVLLVLAAAAFVYAARQAWAGRLSVRRVIWVGVGLHVLALLVPLFLSRDVYSYAFYGRMVSEYGVNPYTHVPGEFLRDPFYVVVSHFWIDSPSVYGPAFSALAAGVTAAVSGIAATVKAFKLLAVLASVATMLIVVAAARRVRPERAALAGLLVGWNPVILWHNAAGGHNDALVGLAVAGAALLLLTRRDLLATAVLTLGALVKMSAAVPLLILLAGSVTSRPRGRRLSWAAAHAGVIALVSLPFVVPFFSLEDPTMGQLELSTRQGWLAPSRFLVVTLRGLVRAVLGETAGEVTSAVIRIAFPLVLLAALWAIGRHLARRREEVAPERTVAAMGWATLLAMMMAPLLLPWYAAWVVPLAWLLPKPARVGAIFLSVALVITELMSEPTRSPRLWEAMVIWLHWVATPIVLAVLVRMLLELRRRLRAGGEPLLDEPPALRSRLLGAIDRLVSGPGEQVAGDGQGAGDRHPGGDPESGAVGEQGREDRQAQSR